MNAGITEEGGARRRGKDPWMFSIFGRLVLLFTLIIIPLFIASFWLYRQAEGIAREQVFEQTRMQMAHTVDRLDSDVNIMLYFLQHIISRDDTLGQVANLPESLGDYNKGKALIGLFDQFYQIRMLSNLMRDVRVHLRAVELTITSYSSYSPFDEGEYMQILSRPAMINNMYLEDGRIRLVLTSPENLFYRPGGKMPSYYLVAELDNDELLRRLASESFLEGTVSVICNGDNSFHLQDGKDDAADEIVARALADDAFSGGLMRAAGRDYLVVKETSEKIGMHFIKLIRFHDTFPIFQTYRNWVAVFILLTLLALAYFILAIRRIVQQPISHLLLAFRKVEQGDFSTVLSYKKNDEFRYLYYRFDKMVENTRNLIEQVYQQEILTQRAELKQMQSQINPHFLYNSLFIISVMARKGDMEFVEAFAEQLGRYFRFIVKNEQEMIPLREEIEYARLYAGIQEARFSGRMSIRINDEPERCACRPVPRLILQPLIENAISALENRVDGGLLHIHFESEDILLRVYVDDNGTTMTAGLLEELQNKLLDSDAARMSGLVNIHRRLRIRFGEGSGLELALLPGGGLRVIMTIRWPRAETESNEHKRKEAAGC